MGDNCCCGNNGLNLIYSCSGAANTGYLADSVSRKLMKDKIGSMTCLSGLGANISGFIVSAQTATKNIIIDGCPVSCGKKIFERLEIPYKQFIMTNYGVEKGKTEITEKIIENITEQLKKEINN